MPGMAARWRPPVDDVLRRGRRLRFAAGAGQPGGRVDGGARHRVRDAGSPTNWAASTSASPRCATGWCWWWPGNRYRSSRRGPDEIRRRLAARRGRRRRRPRPPGHADQAAGLAGPPRGSVGVGGVVSGAVSANDNSSAPGWWCSPVTTVSPARGCRPIPPEVTAQMVANFDARRRGDQRAGRDGRARRCGSWTSRSTPTRCPRRSARTRCDVAAATSPSRTR